MTVDTLSDQKLAEIARGCEGVTAGPWAADPDDRPDMEWNVHIVQAEAPDNRIAFMTSDGTPETAAHIARLDPSTVLSLVTELQSSRATIDGLLDPAAVRVNILRGTIAIPDDLVWLHDTNGPVAEMKATIDGLRGERDAAVARAPKEQVVGWTNLYHLRRFLDGTATGLSVICERNPDWNMALYLSPDDLRFVPKELLEKGQLS